MIGKVAIWRNSSNPQCYVWYKFLDVHNYTSAQFDQIKQRIAQDDGTEWKPDYVEKASPGCYSAAKIEEEKLSALQSHIHFTEKANISRFLILSEVAKVFREDGTNTLTQQNFDKDRVVIISIEGYDDNEIKELKNKYKEYLHLIFSNENGNIKFSRIESPDEFIDKLSHISELINKEPWGVQAIIVYEVADLLDKGIEHLKIPESVWSCDNESNAYKKVVSYLMDTQFPVLIGNEFIGNKLNKESRFAFVCGLWNGTVDIVQSVPKLVKILTCALHPDCRDDVSSKWESFQNAIIEDENGNIICRQDEYFCKAMQMISSALNELVEDDCKLAHTVGSVVGPIAVMCVGDVAAGDAVITRLGTVGSGLKYAIKGLQLCDKVTDITRPLAKGIKVSTALVKKAGKLLPEIRMEGKTILHYIGEKLHIRRFDAVTKQTIDEPVDESNLSQKIEEALERFKDATSVGKYSLANISKERGFIDMLPELLKKEGLTMDDFHYMMQKHTHALTKAEKAKLTRIRNAMPKPDAKTLMQKVISKDAINNYLREVNPYTTIGGYVTRASDAKHLKTYDDLYYGLRLDYINDRGNLMNFVEDGSCGVIRFKTESISELSIPREELIDKNKYPYTGHGFTSGKQGRIGAPEFKFRDDFYAKPEEGAELWEIYSDGAEVLRAVYEERNGIKRFYKISK